MSHGEDKIYSCSKFLSRRASKPTALMQTVVRVCLTFLTWSRGDAESLRICCRCTDVEFHTLASTCDHVKNNVTDARRTTWLQ